MSKAPNRHRGARGSQTCHYCKCAVFSRGTPEAIANPRCIATKDHQLPQLFAAPTDKRVLKAANIVTACQQCNNVKGPFPPEVFAVFLRSHLGTSQFTHPEFLKFVYALSLAGLKAAVRDARQVAAERRQPAPRMPLGKYTARDLRKDQRASA